MEEEGAPGLTKWLITLILVIIFGIVTYLIWKKIESGVFG